MDHKTIYRGEEEIYIPKDNVLSEIFCINDEKAYFVHGKVSETGMKRWYLESYDLNTEEFRTCCVLDDAEDWYQRNFSKDYKERDGYYKDGKIVLNNKKTVLVFDIDSQDVQKYLYEEYEFPEQEAYGECVEYDTIRIVADGKEELWNLEKMAETSTSIDKLSTFKSKMIGTNISYTERFFTKDCVQCIEDKIYCCGFGFNYAGEGYSIILEYDTECDIWKYVTSHWVHDDVYIIPEYF